MASRAEPVRAPGRTGLAARWRPGRRDRLLLQLVAPRTGEPRLGRRGSCVACRRGRAGGHVVLLAPSWLPPVGVFRIAAAIVRGEAASLGGRAGRYGRIAHPRWCSGDRDRRRGLVRVRHEHGERGTSVRERPVGWAFATLAAWGLVAVALASVIWPLLIAIRDRTGPGRLRTAGCCGPIPGSPGGCCAAPVRFGAHLDRRCRQSPGFAVLIARAILTAAVRLAARWSPAAIVPAADRKRAGVDRHPDGDLVTLPIQVGPSTITINRDDRFVVCQPDGRIERQADEGFFARDTRFISGYELWINGRRPVLLNSSPVQFYSARFEFTNEALLDDIGPVPRHSLSFRLDRTVGGGRPRGLRHRQLRTAAGPADDRDRDRVRLRRHLRRQGGPARPSRQPPFPLVPVAPGAADGLRPPRLPP